MDSSSDSTQTQDEKNWLIRTTQRQILGPVSKEKLISFVQKGALGPEDEVMSGNGYWFSLKEKELLDKYLFSDIPQSFNPIGEAKTVLSISEDGLESAPYSGDSPTISLDLDKLDDKDEFGNDFEIEKRENKNKKEDLKEGQSLGPDLSLQEAEKIDDGDVKVPEEDDLAYPDPEELSFGDGENEGTQVVKIAPQNDRRGVQATDGPEIDEQKRSELFKQAQQEVEIDDFDGASFGETANQEEEGHLPKDQDLEYPSLDEMHIDEEEKDEDQALVEDKLKEVKDIKNAKTKEKNKKSKKKDQEAPKRNDRYLIYILFLIVLLTLGVFYYYKSILNKPFPLTSFLISDVRAQSLVQDPSGLKKKEFLSLSL